MLDKRYKSVKSDYALAIEWVVKCFGIYCNRNNLRGQTCLSALPCRQSARIDVYGDVAMVVAEGCL